MQICDFLVAVVVVVALTPYYSEEEVDKEVSDLFNSSIESESLFELENCKAYTDL